MEQGERRDAAIKTFATDGYLCLRQVLPVDQVQQWSERYASAQFFQNIFEQLYNHGHTAFPTHVRNTSRSSSVASIEKEGKTNEATPVVEYAMGKGVKEGFREIVMRSPGRYEIAVNDEHREAILEMIQQHMPFVPRLLCEANTTTETALTWKDVKIVNLSVVISTHGALEQAWHADGGHVNLHEHVACHCLNLFVPLTSVTADTGPTELRPGTHYHTRNLTPFMLAAAARKTLRPPVAPTLEPGDCLLFDYRILHRGKANLTTRLHRNNRTILVVAVAQPWFKDVVNFPSRSLLDTAARSRPAADG